MPELAVDPGDAGDEAVGLDGAENRPGLGVDLVDLSIPILPHPEHPFGPREPRVTAAAGRRDRGEHTAGLGIDLLDALLRELKQVLAVERRSCMRGDIDRANRLPARRIERVQLVSGRKPDVLTVKRDPMHVVDTWKGSILIENFGCRSFHASVLEHFAAKRIRFAVENAAQRSRELFPPCGNSSSQSEVEPGVTRLS